jgi:predicted outer membrane protein
MKRSNLKFPLLLSCALVAGTCLQAQVDNNSSTTSNSSAITNKPVSDKAFIEKSIRDNRAEIEMAQMAIEKSDNENVKHLAQMLVDDHSKMVQDLTRIGGASVAGDAESADNSAIGEEGRSPAGDTGTASNQLDLAGTKTTKDLDSASANAADSTTANADSVNSTTSTQPTTGDTKAMLESASGNEFDRLWIDHMLVKHKIKLGDLHQAKTSVEDQRLKTLINTAIPKIRAHRDMLMEVKNDPDKPLKMKSHAKKNSGE